MKDVFILDYVRSPFTPSRCGNRAGVRPDEMAAQVIRGLIGKTGIPPNDIEDVIVGCSTPEAEQGYNVARNIEFVAGVAISAAATTVNRFCGSSTQSIHIAAGAMEQDTCLSAPNRCRTSPPPDTILCRIRDWRRLFPRPTSR